MKLYLIVIKNTIAEYMAYRLNFILWRVRMTIRLLVIYFLWQAIFANRGVIFGYKQSQIMTYILSSQIVATIIMSTKTQDVGGEIQQGNLTNWLLRPINYFHYLISRDLADKLLNIGFAIIEIGAIIFIFHPPIFYQTNPFLLILFFLSIALGIALFFCISLILGLLSFWTLEAWAPRFLFVIINEFLSGGLFPLDILPPIAFKALSFLPFPYLLYFPLQVYLGKLSPSSLISGFILTILWVLVLSYLLKIIWSKGLKLYTAEGR